MFDFGRKAFIAALLAGVTAPAFAADLPDPVIVDPIPVVYGGWYLRGHIGMSNQQLGDLNSVLFENPAILEHSWPHEGKFASAPIFGGGIGYQFNDFLRGDISVEYRGASDFNATDFVRYGGPNNFYTNDYSAKKTEWLMLANAYADVGTFYGITPYVGAGIGASRNTISGFRDVNVERSGAGYAGDASQWNFAWALHAGLGVKATERMTIDLGYSFVNLGDARTGTFYNDDPAVAGAEGFKFNNITSHDLKLGVRYSLN